MFEWLFLLFSGLDENEWDKGLTDDMEGLSVEELEAQINQMLEKQENWRNQWTFVSWLIFFRFNCNLRMHLV